MPAGVTGRVSKQGADLRALLKAFWNIALLRNGPQGLPPSEFLLGAVLTAYLALQVVSSLNYFSLGPAVLASLLDLALLAGFIQLLLNWYRHPARFRQTLLAICGCWVLLGLAALPFIRGVAVARMNEADPGFALLALLVLLIWSLVVMAHVLRQALEIPLALALALTLVYFLVSQFLLEVAVPMPAVTG